MNENEYIKRADYNDIKNIVEFIRRNIEENKFYFDFEENGENSYKIYEEDYVKKLLDKGDDILLYIENGQIVGLSHWTSVYGIPYNLYTVSDGHNSNILSFDLYPIIVVYKLFLLSLCINDEAKPEIFIPWFSHILNILLEVGKYITKSAATGISCFKK